MAATNQNAAGNDGKSFRHEDYSAPLMNGQGVCLGSGIGSLKEQYETSIALERGVSLLILPDLLHV